MGPQREHNCKKHLEFQAELGAPGIGYSYKCTICSKAFYTRNKKDFYPLAKMRMEDVVLTISDVI